MSILNSIAHLDDTLFAQRKYVEYDKDSIHLYWRRLTFCGIYSTFIVTFASHDFIVLPQYMFQWIFHIFQIAIFTFTYDFLRTYTLSMGCILTQRKCNRSVQNKMHKVNMYSSCYFWIKWCLPLNFVTHFCIKWIRFRVCPYKSEHVNLQDKILFVCAFYQLEGWGQLYLLNSNKMFAYSNNLSLMYAKIMLWCM